jgi:plasmid replication initiation protein
MSDYKQTNLVVQANSLIRQANWNMKAVPLKVFKVLISCIDTKNPPKDNKVTITKKELNDLLGSEVSDGSYPQLKKAVLSLQQQIVELRLDESKIMTLSIAPYVTWDHESDLISVEFGRNLMPYLIELKEKFTQYPVANLTAFSSKYGLILYEWLKSEEYKTMDRDQNVIEIDDLRRLTGTVKKYADFRNFEKKVLKAAVNDINDSALEFLVSYDKVKVGRSITAIRFKTRPRQSYKEKTFDQPNLFEI